MSLVRYEPWGMINQLHGQLTRLFDQELQREFTGADPSSAVTADWMPLADVYEYTDRYVLKLDVPGVDAAAIDITLDQGILSVSGERSKEILAKEVERSRTERPQGRFHRRFTLPDTVDATAVSATSRNGIVEVTIPKQAKAQPRRIEIAAS
ncbi:heat-shock protein Hsp20 [Steroidobacter denitrificans]|uniref:Heat-shock protein Hsp20 n=1 Tax=Steroidobacter denitrificans TaxID=465721 RepID=A0A127F9X8_STEDE|nr:Hsp20/alpha crystallin family protein [Steroidobacter denitrificans]AMN47222.1 heat-shock protein Hsp20 [Steroidobacter denitrificans]